MMSAGVVHRVPVRQRGDAFDVRETTTVFGFFQADLSGGGQQKVSSE